MSAWLNEAGLARAEFKISARLIGQPGTFSI